MNEYETRMIEQQIAGDDAERSYQRDALIGKEWPEYVRALDADPEPFDGWWPVIDRNAIVTGWESSRHLFEPDGPYEAVAVLVSDHGYEYRAGFDALMTQDEYNEYAAAKHPSSDSPF